MNGITKKSFTFIAPSLCFGDLFYGDSPFGSGDRIQSTTHYWLIFMIWTRHDDISWFPGPLAGNGP